MWLFLQLLRHQSDESLRVCVPRALPQLQPPFGTCVYPSVCGQSPLPTLASSGGVPNQCMYLSYLKPIGVLQSSLPMSWDMGSAHREAAKLLWNHTSVAQRWVLPESLVGRGEEGSSLYLSGCKDGLSPSSRAEARGLKLVSISRGH